MKNIPILSAWLSDPHDIYKSNQSTYSLFYFERWLVNDHKSCKTKHVPFNPIYWNNTPAIYFFSKSCTQNRVPYNPFSDGIFQPNFFGLLPMINLPQLRSFATTEAFDGHQWWYRGSGRSRGTERHEKQTTSKNDRGGVVKTNRSNSNPYTTLLLLLFLLKITWCNFSRYTEETNTIWHFGWSRESLEDMTWELVVCQLCVLKIQV